MLFSTSQFFLSSLLLIQYPLSSLAAFDKLFNKAYDVLACNNSPRLCKLSYGAITHLGTHNSPFLRDQTTSFSMSGNQYFNVTVQLNAGIRLLQGQLHKDPDDSTKEPRMCHSSCTLLDAGTLGDWLKEVKDWLDNHPSEVVTLLIANEGRSSAKELLPSFTKTGTDKLAYVPPDNTRIREFPKLETMIKADKNLVVFVTNGDDKNVAPFLLNEWNYIWETKWENTDPDEWSCDVDRPGRLRDDEGVERAEKEGVVPLLNWFLYSQMGLGILRPNVEAIQNTNGPSLTAGLATCKKSKTWKALPPPRAPTFVLVDFFNEGNPIDHIDALNNVTNPANRVKPPQTPTETSAIKGSTKGKSGGERVLDELLYQIDNGLIAHWGDWILAGGDWGTHWTVDFNRLTGQN